MSKKRTENAEHLPTLQEVVESAGLQLLPDDAPAPVGLPSWVGEPEGVPLPAALTVELSAIHDQKRVAEAEVARLEGERSALFRGFLVGAGLGMTATYDLSTGRVTVPASE